MTNLIAMIVADDRFTSLHRALTAAGMVDTLGGSGPFTLFAPTNAAFVPVSDALFEREARDQLTKLMTFHAVAGKSLKADLRDGQRLPTIHGEPLHIRLEHDRICVNNVEVIAEIEAANGFIYAIETLLMPATTP